MDICVRKAGRPLDASVVRARRDGVHETPDDFGVCDSQLALQGLLVCCVALVYDACARDNLEGLSPPCAAIVAHIPSSSTLANRWKRVPRAGQLVLSALPTELPLHVILAASAY